MTIDTSNQPYKIINTETGANQMQIGGTKRKPIKATQPMFVVQLSPYANEYMKLTYDGQVTVEWVGDPNAATQFSSKYAAKARIRELADVPETRCFKEL